MSAFALLLAAIVTQQQPDTRPHEINMWVGRDVAPSSKIRVTINTRNLPMVHVDAYPVDPIEWLTRRDTDGKRPKAIGPSVRTWDLNVAAGTRTNNPEDNYFSRQVNMPPLKPGVYMIVVKGADKDAFGVINVTNLAVVTKRSPHHLLAWTTNFKTGLPVEGADVAIYRGGALEAHRASVADGTALLASKPGGRVIVVRKGDDLAGISTDAEDPDGHLQAHFQTDRPIYRPGQTVSYKAILRLTQGRGYRPVTTGDVVVRLRDSRDNPLDEVTLKPTPMGTVAGSFKIPQEAITGPYTISLRAADQDAYNTFTVAAYRKPEYKVDVMPANRRYLAGETVRFKVNAAYFFGAPVPQARVHWVGRASGMPFFTPDPAERMFYGGDGNLYPRDTYASSPVAGEGETVTDNDGNAVIEIKTDPNAGDQTYSVDLTVEDASRRQVQGSSGVPVYAAAVRVGITSSQQVTPLGALIPLELRLVDLDGHPVGGKAHLNLVEQVWIEKEGRYRDQVIAERNVTIPPTGKIETSLPARKEGSLRVDVVVPDGTGRKTRASLWAYVTSPFYKPPRENPQPTLDLKLDRRVYTPGQAVTAYLSTNRPTRPMLVVIEGGEIFSYKVLPGGQTGRSWKFNATVEESPNAWVTATEWSEHGVMQANAILPVPDPTRKISVEAIPEKSEVRPGDPMRIAVRTRDYTGKPIPAEVSLSVVDEAIYALSPDTTPDPYGFYWGVRSNRVSTAASAPEEVSGGAYQRTNSSAPVRQRFEDTAYWNAFVMTGADGNGTAEFEVPGNLTTWRAAARGVTLGTQVGIGRSNFVATRPLTLRLATPRMVSVGDEFTLIGTINNRSPQPVSVEVQMTPTGIEIPGGDQKVEVPAKSERTVRWRLRASRYPTEGKFTLLARANGPTADLSDALQVSVPVVPRGVRETAQSAGAINSSASANLTLPTNTLPDGAVLSVRVFAGMGPAASQAADRIFASARYGSPMAADALIAATATSMERHSDDVREALALLSRTQHPDGWGWWEDAPTDPVITARVGHALALARSAGVRIFDQTWEAAKNGARSQYDRSNLWEHRAQLAATMYELGEPHATDAVKEVLARGLHLSPYSQIRLAEVLIGIDPSEGRRLLGEIVKLVSDGPSDAFMPVGEGIGWTASETDTNAELLTLLVSMKSDEDLQRKLAYHLALRQGWRSADEDAAVARALWLYGKKHPSASEAGRTTVTVNGQTVELANSTVEPSASVDIPLTSLPVGPIRIQRNGQGEALYTVSLRYYRDVLVENATGIRVSRRFEVKNPAGIWTEVDRVIHPGEPVRCTLVVWGDDRSDAVRVNEPIPAGFEFTDADETAYAQQDVRDGAVVHYLMNTGTPVFFRYYLRAESDGRLVALPAIAEYLRRPGQHGQSAARELEVHP